jgi:hypothetical protein
VAMFNPMSCGCPACGAKPGERCQTMTGNAMPQHHFKRQRVALDKEHPPSEQGQGPRTHREINFARSLGYFE